MNASPKQSSCSLSSDSSHDERFDQENNYDEEILNESLYGDMQQDSLDNQDVKVQYKELKRKINDQNSQDFNHWELHPQVLNQLDKWTGTSLIHYACEIGNIRFLKDIKKFQGERLLFDLLRNQSKSGKSALHFACQSADYKILKIIVKNYNKIDCGQLQQQLSMKELRNRNTPLHLLLLNNRKKEVDVITKCVKVLKKHLEIKQVLEYNISMKNSLELSVKNGYLEVLRILIKVDEQAKNYSDIQSNSLMHLACQDQNKEILQMLLDEGLNYIQTNSQNQTPYQIAYENGNMDIYKNVFRDDQTRNDKRMFKDVLIHLDFKGAPPTFNFLKRFLNFIGERYKNLVTGIIMEFEDTFPYEGYLSQLKGINFYTKDQLKEIKLIMDQYNFRLIPLVQTFGHLEFVLKKERFIHLRESDDSYQSVCPLKKESMELVLSMIDQNISMFGIDSVKIIHLGADEVFNLATCNKCQYFIEETSKATLYANFVMKMCKKVKQKYPGIEIMIWDDMYRNFSFLDFRTLKSSGGLPEFQPCIWAYSGHQEQFNQTIKTQSFNNLCLEFKKVWVASCFRGSCEPSTTMPDFNERLQNHKLWIDKIKQNPCSQKAVQGIVLTGWTVVEQQQLNLNIIFKESVAHLNLKGKHLINGINELLNFKTLEEFYQTTPYIDEKRPSYFCNDSFEICWNITKAVTLLQLTKKSLKDSSVINYDKIMRRQNKFILSQYEIFKEGCQKYAQNDDTMTIDTRDLGEDGFSSSDSLNNERLNPATRNKLLDYLRVAIKLLKKAGLMSDKILPQYMFSRDIEEFKNSKILKHLHQAFIILEGLTERTRATIMTDFQFQPTYNQQFKRVSQTPNIMSSPLLLPEKNNQDDDRNLMSNIFPKLNDALLQLDRITSLQPNDQFNNGQYSNFSSANSLQPQRSYEITNPAEFKIPLIPKRKSRIPKKYLQISKRKDYFRPFHFDNSSDINISTLSNPSEEEKTSLLNKKRERKILRKRQNPNPSNNQMRNQPASNQNNDQQDTFNKYRSDQISDTDSTNVLLNKFIAQSKKARYLDSVKTEEKKQD
eukprot:403336902